MAISLYTLKGFSIGYNVKTFPTFPVVYKITNTVNNKVYIGSTINIRKRINDHRLRLKRGKHSSSHLQKSFNKYGIDAFRIEIIEKSTKEECSEREMHWIEKLKSNNRESGYNMVLNSSMPFYGPKSDIHKKRISESLKGRVFTEEWRKNISKGRKGICKGINNSLSKAIIQYSKDLTVIEEFISITEAALKTGISRTGINNSLLGWSKTSGGYIWKYKTI